MPDMTPDIPSIRSRHATAMATRKRGTFDSRDDDIGVLMAEVDRLTALCREAYESEVDYWKSDDGTDASEGELFVAAKRRDAAINAVYREGGMK